MAKTEADLTTAEQKLATDEAAMEQRIGDAQAALQKQIDDLKAQIAAGQPIDFSAHVQALEEIDAKLSGVDAAPAATPPA